MSDAPRLLEGIKVLDVGTWIAGPVTTTVMADFGADVIKIEPPGAGDPYRQLHKAALQPKSEFDYGWIVDNRNKRSISLDLKRPEAREVLKRLVGGIDVYVTNQPPDVRARFGLNYEDLKPLNERMIYGLISGYGETGPDAQRRAFDVMAWWGRSGLQDFVRSAGSPPGPAVPGMGDHPTGMSLFGAVMAALYQRERTGKGAKVTTTLLANGLWSNATLAQAALLGAEFRSRPHRSEAMSALANLYETRDGRWFMLNFLRTEEDWQRLARTIGREDLLQDARFENAEKRLENPKPLIEIFDALFAARDWADWEKTFKTGGVTYSIVGRTEDVATDEQMRVSGAVIPLDHPAAGSIHTVNSPIWIDGEEKVTPRAAPDVGEHTLEVLREAGYEAAEIDALRAAGAIG